MSSNAERVQNVVRRTGLAFVHAGTLFDPSRLTDELKQLFEAQALEVVVADASSIADLDGNGSQSEAVIIYDMGTLVGTGDLCRTLANARPVVTRRLEDGSRVVMISTAPRTRMLGCPGSQLVIDAAPCYPERYSNADLERIVTEEAPGTSVRRLESFSGGLPRLVHELAAVSATGQDDDEVRMRASELLKAEMGRAVAELGPDIASTVEHLVTATPQGVFLHDEVDSLVVEALRGSGLGSSDDGWSSFRMGFDGPLGTIFEETLLDYVAETTDLPEDYEGAVRDMWFIERSLRAEVRSLAIATHGDSWRSRLVGAAVAERVVDRAAVEEHPDARTLADVPNPIEWMTFNELLDMITSEDWARPWALRPSYWTRMKTILGPIRDRLAHMRLLRAGDAKTMKDWRRKIELVERAAQN